MPKETKKDARIAVLHFNPIKMYPPAMNMLEFLSNINRYKIITYSTSKSKSEIFNSANSKIVSFGAISSNKIRMYILYAYFNIGSIFGLIITKPKIIIGYETLSFLPIWIYKIINPKVKLFIHYHEYTSPAERHKASFYMKLLLNLEKKIIKKAIWISQTNIHRLSFFQYEFSNILDNNKLHVIQNFPPKSWNNNINSINIKKNHPLKLVYVGSLSFKYTFIREISEWIKKQDGNVVMDIYSSNFDKDIQAFIMESDNDYIIFKDPIKYNDLPKILTNYDIGIIFYKGLIPNHTFSAPNKLFEYLVCGLDVWISNELIISKEYINTEDIDRVKYIDFNSIPNLDTLVEPTESINKISNYCYENEYIKILKVIEQQMTK